METAGERESERVRESQRESESHQRHQHISLDGHGVCTKLALQCSRMCDHKQTMTLMPEAPKVAWPGIASFYPRSRPAAGKEEAGRS